MARTALGVAAMRAQESARPDRWFDDSYAGRFLEAAGWDRTLPDADAVEDPVWRSIMRSSIVRTRFLDELLATGDCPQVVLLGAGLDSRAFRLDWATGTTLYELDQPEVLAFKDEVLAADVPRCERRPVAIDLLDDWPAALEVAGHDPARPTTWVAEGLLMYFDDAGVETMLRRITNRSPAGSRLAITLRASTGAVPERMVGMWRSSAPDDPVAWLAGFGWMATVAAWGERAAAWGRPHWDTGAKAGLVDAVRTLAP
ncbi:MAG: SAM-dependent methyltransferase [Actinomycetia bacterium]|nr:SAM-dependent methyltransferase [Actinomycetes bacterium]